MHSSLCQYITLLEIYKKMEKNVAKMTPVKSPLQQCNIRFTFVSVQDSLSHILRSTSFRIVKVAMLVEPNNCKDSIFLCIVLSPTQNT